MALDPSRHLRLHCNMQRLLLCWQGLQRRMVSFFILFFNYNYMAYICLAVINQLMKSQAFKSVGKPSKEIPRPQKITNLQHDMGLADNKKSYSHCRVSLFLSSIVSP